MKITKNFSLNEFTRSATADKLGIDNSLPLDGISDLYIKNQIGRASCRERVSSPV